MAFTNVSNKQVVVNGTNQFSAAIPMNGGNTCKAGITVFANTATSLSVNIQGSNDLQNWTDGTADTGFVVGYAATANRTIAFAYVRLSYIVVGTGTIIVAADLNISQQ